MGKGCILYLLVKSNFRKAESAGMLRLRERLHPLGRKGMSGAYRGRRVASRCAGPGSNEADGSATKKRVGLT